VAQVRVPLLDANLGSSNKPIVLSTGGPFKPGVGLSGAVHARCPRFAPRFSALTWGEELQALPDEGHWLPAVPRKRQRRSPPDCRTQESRKDARSEPGT
jgi:hypothetical protein